MGLVEERRYIERFERYVAHVSHWVKKEKIRNPVTGDTHRARINLPHGFEYEVAEIGRGVLDPRLED